MFAPHTVLLGSQACVLPWTDDLVDPRRGATRMKHACPAGGVMFGTASPSLEISVTFAAEVGIHANSFSPQTLLGSLFQPDELRHVWS